jgi:hypothetical protein
MSEATEAIRIAEQRGAARETARQPIDYAEMNRILPRQKAALTRAINSGDRDKLILVVRDAVRDWNRIGSWPDDWARWQRALDDKLGFYHAIDISDLG